MGTQYPAGVNPIAPDQLQEGLLKWASTHPWLLLERPRKGLVSLQSGSGKAIEKVWDGSCKGNGGLEMLQDLQVSRDLQTLCSSTLQNPQSQLNNFAELPLGSVRRLGLQMSHL